MLKTYDVTCPSCHEDFEVEMDPLTEKDCIECPNCYDEVDWEHDATADTVTLLPNDDDDLDEADALELSAEEGDEEEDELA